MLVLFVMRKSMIKKKKHIVDEKIYWTKESIIHMMNEKTLYMESIY